MTMTGTLAERPAKMSEEVKSLITRCWSGDPNLRPLFGDILPGLEQIDFKILPGVDSLTVKRFVKEVHGERKTR
jgi:hypothetical protein